MRSTENSYDYISIPFTNFPEEKILDYARSNTKLFTKLPVSRITVSDEEGANEVVSKYTDRRQDMGAFSELAAEYSRDSYKDDGGSMGSTDYYRISELIGSDNTDSVFDLGEGDLAGPFDTDYGWMIFRADGSTEISDPAERIEEIRSYMLQNEVGILEDAIITMAEELRVKAIAVGSFKEAMTENGIQIQTSSAFPVNFAADSLLGGSPENSDDPVLNGTASNEDFWNKIVSLTDNEDISKPIVLNGSVALFSLAASNKADKIDYFDKLVDYEIARSRQTDFQAAVVNPESKLFDDNFSEAYSRYFPEQG
ncbi:MAG: peptidyl-prolyl cis-trans isomerase, partial [Spirochaetaceae bacterium]|nr:peptidyl-prolyl cis-trans isomerase [Spirochaetaceae bacterium]